jgi:hypothetical protein
MDVYMNKNKERLLEQEERKSQRLQSLIKRRLVLVAFQLAG